MEYAQRLGRNPRLLFWGRAFLETKALTAIIVLFYLHRGVSFDEVIYLSIVFSVVSLLTEVPSGYLADRIGRKRTLLLGAVLFFLSYFTRFFAYGFWPFTISFVLVSAAFSCFSGTEEAMLYESLKATRRENEMTLHNGRLFSARSLFRIAFPTLGAFIANDLLEWQFLIVNAIDVVAALIAFVFFLFLVETPHEKKIATEESDILKQSVRTLREHPWMWSLTVNRWCVFTASFLTWRVYQPLLVEHGLSTFVLGWFYFFSGLAGFGSTWFLGSLESRIGNASFLFWTALIAACMLFVSLFADHAWVLFASLLLVEIFATMREPAFARRIHHFLKDESRVTTASNLNMVKGVLDIPLLFLAGMLSTMNIRFPLFIAFVLCLVAITVFPVREHRLATQPSS